MMQKDEVLPPPVVWAQRRNIVFVTICLEDCKNPIIKTEPKTLYFKGLGGTEKKMYEVTINLYEEIDPSKTVQNIRDRIIELILTKKEGGPYWPRLTKEKMKVHWLKCDFNKWEDEDDSDDGSGNTTDLAEMLQQLGGLDDSGDRKQNFDSLDLDIGGEDSDDEYIPNLE